MFCKLHAISCCGGVSTVVGEFCDDFIGKNFADSMLSAVVGEFWRVVGELLSGS